MFCESTSVNSLSMMTPDSARPVSVCYDGKKGNGRRTVLADGSETLFESPARSAGEWEWLEDFDGLRGVHDAFWVELGQAPDGIASRNALVKVCDILVVTWRMGCQGG